MNNTEHVSPPGADTDRIPKGLILYRRKMYFSSAAVFASAAAAAVCLQNTSVLLFALAALYLWYRGFLAEHDFRSGTIRESAVVCTDIRISAVRNRVILSFRAADDSRGGSEASEILTFSNLPRRSAEDFSCGSPYFVYYSINSPHVLLFYLPQ